MLCLLLMPTAAFAAEYREGDIAGTTGNGTESDPVICDTYDELKAALEYNEDLCIQVDSFQNTAGLDHYALQSGIDYDGQNAPAISVPANTDKSLVINTDINLRAAGKPFLRTLIKVSANLTISGQVPFPAPSADFPIRTRSSMFLPRKCNSKRACRNRRCARKSYSHASAVENYSGYLTINGGTFTGYSPDQVAESNENSRAVRFGKASMSTVIAGGTFKSTTADENGHAYGLHCLSSEIDILGGKFYGISGESSGCKLSDFLKSGYSYNYYKMSDWSLFDAGGVDSTTETLFVSGVSYVTSIDVTCPGYTFGGNIADAVSSCRISEG